MRLLEERHPLFKQYADQITALLWLQEKEVRMQVLGVLRSNPKCRLGLPTSAKSAVATYIRERTVREEKEKGEAPPNAVALTKEREQELLQDEVASLRQRTTAQQAQIELYQDQQFEEPARVITNDRHRRLGLRPTVHGGEKGGVGRAPWPV
jgi:hypothetical protein